MPPFSTDTLFLSGCPLRSPAQAAFLVFPPGTPTGDRTFHPALLREAARVLLPLSRLAVLTGDMRTFAEAFWRAPGFTEQAEYPVRVLGQAIRAYVLVRSRGVRA